MWQRQDHRYLLVTSLAAGSETPCPKGLRQRVCDHHTHTTVIMMLILGSTPCANQNSNKKKKTPPILRS